MLCSDVNKILKKYGINRVFYDGDYFIDVDALEKNIINSVINEIEGDSTSIYPYGKFGQEIASLLSQVGCNIQYMVDNNTDVDNGTICFDEWMIACNSDVVLVCSVKMSNQFVEQLHASGYKGKIVDVRKLIMQRYPNFPPCTIDDFKKKPEVYYTYEYLNKLELKYVESDYVDEAIFRDLIYGLSLIRDFNSASNYIERFSGSHELQEKYIKYTKEISSRFEKIVSNLNTEDVTCIHIIDSFTDNIIDKMPFVSNISKTGIRLEGVRTEYPCTHYAINTMFSGRDTFSIDVDEMVKYTDSELLHYIQDNNIKFSLVSSNDHIMREFENINCADRAICANVSTMLFEGLCLLEKKSTHHLIVLHSCGELHSDFFSVGYKNILKKVSDMESKDQIVDQYDHAIEYVDQQIEWYYPFYTQGKVKNVFVGDHGVSVDGVYNYFWGVKKDYPRCSLMDCSPAFIIPNINKKMVISGIIPSQKEPRIILDIIKSEYEDIFECVEKYALIRQVPGYGKVFVSRFVSRGIYSQYEGAVGVFTDESMYIKYNSGKEDYFRPNEFSYRNLIRMKEYSEDIDSCRQYISDTQFPMDILNNPKYGFLMSELERIKE